MVETPTIRGFFILIKFRGTMYPHVLYKNKIPNIVRYVKTLASKEIGESIFQCSFYDHIIRKQDDYNEKWEYIENNPVKWMLMKNPILLSLGFLYIII